MQPLWRLLIADFKIKACPENGLLWSPALDYVESSRKLKFAATGRWAWKNPAAGAVGGKRDCGPDGDFNEPLSADALAPDVFIGALIGKFGGSSASLKNTNAYAVGSHCIVEVTDTMKGPLYLTINDTPLGMKDNSGELLISIWEAL